MGVMVQQLSAAVAVVLLWIKSCALLLTPGGEEMGESPPSRQRTLASNSASDTVPALCEKSERVQGSISDMPFLSCVEVGGCLLAGGALRPPALLQTLRPPCEKGGVEKERNDVDVDGYCFKFGFQH